jgi:hypothetical protein
VTAQKQEENKPHRTKDKTIKIAGHVSDTVRVVGKISEGLP